MRIFGFIIVVIWVYSHKCLALPDIIRIGGIFNSNDEWQELAFRYAVQNINKDRNILPTSHLKAQIEQMPADDSFHASKRVCQLLRTGVAGIFGPQSENTANHVQSICDAMEIPHIETRWDFKLTRDAYSVNLYPHPSTLSQAYFDIIKALGWKQFVILYDENSGLVRLQTLLKVKEWTVSIRQLNEGDDWRPLLKEIKKSQETKFVVDVSQKILFEVLNQAYQIGLMREYHSYFITSLDMHLVDIEDFRYGGTNITALRLIDPNKPEVKKMVESWFIDEARHYGRIISDEIKQITTEAALMFDAVHLFARALSDLDGSKEVQISTLYCEGDKTWQHGNSLINYMKWYSSRRSGETEMNNLQSVHGTSGVHRIDGTTRVDGMTGRMTAVNSLTGKNPNMRNIQDYPYTRVTDHNFYQPHGSGMYSPNLTSASTFNQVQVHGLTGLIKFDAEGFRTDVEFEITELDQKEGMKKVGTWTKTGGANYTRSQSDRMEAVAMNLQNRTLTVVTAKAQPYTMLKETSEHLVGNDRFEGFCVDLIEKVAGILKFNYTFVLEPNDIYGSRNKETKEWDGMIKTLLDHKADLGIVDFTITYEREEAVDFSMPFMNLGIGIIFKKPQKKAPSLFSFMSPFSIDVWIYMATAYLGVSVLLFILARMSPSEWDSPYPCIQEPEELENCFTLQNSLWFIIATFLCQGADIAPRAVSTRIVAGIWWFFTLIMISSYTANLAAFLTVERMESPIEGAEDLAKQTKIKYGCKEGGSTYAFFAESKISTYQRMWAAMSSARPTVFTKDNDAGVERVSNANGMYAFLMESSSIEYVVERRCDLMQVGGLLDSKSYGIALPPGSPYTGAISSAILKLKEDGVIHELKTKWWKRRKGGGHCVNEDAKSSSGKAAELGLPNVGGVFVVLIGGMGISAVTAICEFLWNARELATDENASFCEELGNEVNFILKCSGNTKPVRKTQSTTPEEPLFTYGSNNYDANYSYGRDKK